LNDNIKLGDNLTRYKRSYLLQTFVKYGRKNLYNIDLRLGKPFLYETKFKTYQISSEAQFLKLCYLECMIHFESRANDCFFKLCAPIFNFKNFVLTQKISRN
jgi:hypothetical protein